jgi:hypothetical protein
MICDGPASLHRWKSHIEGATRLIELRGLEQLRSPQGLEMFTNLRPLIVGQYAILTV